MPQYKVLSKGYHNGVLYKPGDPKSGVLRREKQFPSKDKKEIVPSWLKRIDDESAAQKKKRESAEAKKATEAAKKAEADKVDVDAVTFTEAPKQTNVEALG